MSASSLSGSPSNPNPPSPSVQKLVSLARPAGTPLARYGLINLSTGSISTLPIGDSTGLNLVDIASSGNDTFALDNLTGLYRVDLNTGNSTRIGFLDSALEGIGFTSLGFDASGTLYTVGTNKRTRQSALYTINVAAGGQTTLVANLPSVVDIGDIVYDAASNRFFASTNTASITNSLLYSVSLTGNTQLIGDIGFSGIGALLFENGILYGYTSTLRTPQNQIIINTKTGTGTFDKQVNTNDSSFSGVSGGA
ncbi:MAG: hypothetical protein HY785_25235 [Oscillatoriophycideae cyanobacterium NC_groundwater_1537_Pr4_S-0.65um_50_18]|nr:hypothetical protein [Oscillatoriophycideae cyanobacterium NC_groundwater_1537_Pr4_S-0.65um_50_18]